MSSKLGYHDSDPKPIFLIDLFPYSDIVTVPLDSLGESITNAVVLSWNKEPGDAVKEDDVIAVVETDKVRLTRSAHLINKLND